MTLPTADRFERAGIEAWPGIELEWDFAWLRRAANGYTRRANCLQCFDPADGDDAAARLDAGLAWLTARGLPPVVRSTPLTSPALDAVLDARNWQVTGRSHLFAMPLVPVAPDREARIFPLLDPDFLAAQQQLRRYDETQLAGLRALLSAMSVPAAGIVLYREGRPVATCLTAIADAITITGNVITDPARRREGLAAAMMRTGHHWAMANGATTAALNVEADNAPAKALYRALGYAHQYDYHYRIPGEPA